MPTMLVVDDEYLVRMRIEETIDWSEYGVKIVAYACDGEEGLELALKHKPDIIITDIRMPLMDGLEFMKKIRENRLESRIIVLSGYDEFDYAKAAVDNGADAYILKPIDNKLLIETVNKVISKIKNDKSTKQYYEKLKEELSSIKKQFIRDLFKGNITDQNEILDKIQFLDIPLEIKDNFVIYIKIDNYDLVVQQLSQDELYNFKNSVTEYAAEMLLLNSKFIGLMVDMEPYELALIIHPYNCDPQEETIKAIKESCERLIEIFKVEFCQTFSLGISKMQHELCNISKAYIEAKKAAEIKFLPRTNTIAFSGENDTAGYRREIKEAIKYIKNNYYRDITVDIVAKELYISPSYLMHLLKNELGKTFNECLTEYRIEAAKELLKNPEYKINEISEKVGYIDAKYFSRVFKKLTGVNPSDYVRLNLER